MKIKRMRAPIKRFKKSFIDMSRRQFRYHNSQQHSNKILPTTALVVDQSTIASASFGGMYDNNNMIPSYNNNNNISNIELLSHSNNNLDNSNNTLNINQNFSSQKQQQYTDPDIRYSTQFKWKKRDYIDANSVYNKPHGIYILYISIYISNKYYLLHYI